MDLIKLLILLSKFWKFFVIRMFLFFFIISFNLLGLIFELIFNVNIWILVLCKGLDIILRFFVLFFWVCLLFVIIKVIWWIFLWVNGKIFLVVICNVLLMCVNFCLWGSLLIVVLKEFVLLWFWNVICMEVELLNNIRVVWDWFLEILKFWVIVLMNVFFFK